MKSIIKAVFLVFFISMIAICLMIILLIPKDNTDYNEQYKPDLTVNMLGKIYSEDASELDLSDVKIDDSIVSELFKFPKLKKVDFKNKKLSPNLQYKLEKVYPYIKFNWKVSILDKLVDSNIEKLDLSKCTIDDIDAFKSSLLVLHKLKYLDLSDCNLSNEKLAELRKEFPNIKVVWKIYFSAWSLKTDAVSFSVLVSNFRYTYLNSNTIEVFKYCTDLQALDLGHQKITDISVIGNHLKNLRVLILADNNISDITPLKKLKHLHYLELFMNRITDISPLASCKELVDLNLSFIPTLHDYSTLLNNDFPLLERLWLAGGYVPSNMFNSLYKKYSKAKVSRLGPGSTGNGWRSHPRYFAMIDMFHKRDYISELFTKYDK